MKPILLALALPVLLAGCTAYVADDYGPGYYPSYYYDRGYYYGDPVVDVGIYSYDRGYYHYGYHHYDSGYRGSAVAFRGSSHPGTHAFASVSRSSGHTSGGHHATVSSEHSHIH